MKRSTSALAGTLQDLGLYDSDFCEWTERTARSLRLRRFAEVDVEHVAEEIEDMGKRDLRELCSRLEILLAHLLEWKLQPRRRSRSWRATIRAQRTAIQKLLRQSPSLRQRLRAQERESYRVAVGLASDETGLKRERFPARCPFSMEEILDEEFLPD
jgi:hypothetical protein